MSDHLRPYQIAAADAVDKVWETSDIAMLNMATGLGKTIIFLEIASRKQPKRTIIFTDRRDLTYQAKLKASKFTKLNVEIEMGEHRARRDLFHNCDALVTTFQSQTPGRRSKPTDFDFIIVDECHGVDPENKSWMEPLAFYREGNPNCKILGVTATPEAECLKYFKNVAFTYDILDGIRDGFLVNVDQKVAHIKSLDFSHIRTKFGDLNTTDLAKVMEEEKPMQKIVQATLEVMFRVSQHSLSNLPIESWGEFLFANGKPMRNLIFCSSVNHARMMSDILNRVRPGLSDWVCSEKKLVTEERRTEIGRRFSEGDLIVCCNMGIYTKGYDNPSIEMVTVARPTESLTLYRQMIGRGTRILDGVINGIEQASDRLLAISVSRKKSLIVLDLAGNSGRHDLITAIDVFGEKVPNDVRKRAEQKSKKSDKPRSVIDLLKESEEELIAEKARREEARRTQDELEAERKKHIIGKTTYSLSTVSPFEKHYGIKFDVPKWWEKQNGRPKPDWLRNLLREKAGVDPDNVSNKSAWDWYTKYKQRPPSAKQLNLMRHLGIKTIPATASEASKLISAAKEGSGRAETRPEAYHQPAPPPPLAQLDGPPLEYYDEVPV